MLFQLMKVAQYSVLNGPIHDVLAVKYYIYILEVRKWRKKFMLTDSFFCHWTSTEGTASLENVPNSHSSAYRRKFYHFFKQNIINDRILKNTHNWILFLVNIWNQERTFEICVVKTTECWTGVTIGNLSWFLWTKTIVSFFFHFKDYYLRNKIM